VIEVTNLTKTFDGFKALDDATLRVKKGCVYGLVGPNGAGKSTIIRHILGIYKQDSGSVKVNGEDIWENAELKEKIASIPDDWYYFPQATIAEMAKFYAGMYSHFNWTRYGKMKEYVEFPSGMVEAGEDPKLAAQRELLEETGYDVSIDDIVPLGNFEANPAFMSNSMFYFYVNLDTARWQLKKQHLDQHEKIELLWSDKQSAFDSYFSTHDSVFKAGLFLLLQKAGIKLS